jgi:hypothetical protein
LIPSGCPEPNGNSRSITEALLTAKKIPKSHLLVILEGDDLLEDPVLADPWTGGGGAEGSPGSRR